MNKYPETVADRRRYEYRTGTGLCRTSQHPQAPQAERHVRDEETPTALQYTHELRKTNWSWMFADGTPFTYGTTTDGTQVVQAPKQNADWFGLRYIYRFQ